MKIRLLSFILSSYPTITSAVGGYATGDYACKVIQLLWGVNNNEPPLRIYADCPLEHPVDNVRALANILPIDDCYANINGTIRPQTHGILMETCINCVMETTRLTCYCDTLLHFSPWPKTIIETNDFIENRNGVMYCGDVKATVT
ncbi:hypothetical protein F5Y18DRAFT_368321 [Xylariaceae sp. FL1019]|nr:hypothetical protein F5Y18DRAFT_368321 [Xylariaceae sp. FL1019]